MVRFPHVYQINPRCRLTELRKELGNKDLTLADIPDSEIQSWADLGFHYVWPMGVWTVSPGAWEAALQHAGLKGEYRHVLPDVTEADVCGSPFAVAGFDVDKELGGNEGLKEFRAKLKKHGLKLLLDFIPNHLAYDHQWTIDRPDLFVQGNKELLKEDPETFYKTKAGEILARGKDPYFPAWSDTVQLDYGNIDTHNAMANELISIADRCDAVRCDMSMLLLPEVRKRVWGKLLQTSAEEKCFWQDTIKKVKEKLPEFLFVAEAYWGTEIELQNRGFDFTYDKELYDRVVHSDGVGATERLSIGSDKLAKFAHFIENHDEPRAAESLKPNRVPAGLTAGLGCPGLRLFHEGQMEGRRMKMPVQLRRRPKEVVHPEIKDFHQRFFQYLQNPVFQAGRWELLKVKEAGKEDRTHHSLVAQIWYADNVDKTIAYLLIANVGEFQSYARLPFDPKVFIGEKYQFHDHADDEKYERRRKGLVEEGLFLSMTGGQAHLFEIRSM